jgi:DNA (cytosine-5)-methyltransferase 1
MSRPLLLDLFCGAGGAAVGYHRAGFDVVGVDVSPQPHYPFEFRQADATTFPLDGFDAIHASPPCQDHSALRHTAGQLHQTGWMLAATRERLLAQSAPWIIENVPGAPLRTDYRLCGCMFDLPRLRRERWFETSWHAFELRPPCHHVGPAVTVAGHGAQGSYEFDENGNYPSQADRRAAMGIDWMNRDELAQAIPPAFTEYIGARLLEQIALRDAA